MPPDNRPNGAKARKFPGSRQNGPVNQNMFDNMGEKGYNLAAKMRVVRVL